MANKVTIKSVTSIADTSFKGGDGTMITGKILTSVCADASGKEFTLPICVYGKLADSVVAGVEVNVSTGQDSQGNKTYTAKKADNGHLVADGGSYSGQRGGGISKSDLIFLGAVSMALDSDTAAFDKAVATVEGLFDHYKASRQTGGQQTATPDNTPMPEGADDDDIPF